MRDARQIAVMAGGVDDDNAIPARQRFDRILKRPRARRLVFRGRMIELAETEMLRRFQLTCRLPGPGSPVLDMMGKAFLPRIEVDGGDALARFHQRHSDVHGDGGLPGPALLVADHDHASGRRPP
jgi:hypothetical protein